MFPAGENSEQTIKKSYMKYRLVQKANPLEPETKRKWYASPVKEGTINNYQLSKGIAGKSSLTRGAVMNVIENMVDEIPRYLIEGYSVNLNNFGTLRLSLSSLRPITSGICGLYLRRHPSLKKHCRICPSNWRNNFLKAA